ncbi:hypothetical protein BDW69DRAFT_169522 [Aspergillus filifer]
MGALFVLSALRLFYTYPCLPYRLTYQHAYLLATLLYLYIPYHIITLRLLSCS